MDLPPIGSALWMKKQTVAPPQITPHGDQDFIHKLVMSLALLSERGKDRVL